MQLLTGHGWAQMASLWHSRHERQAGGQQAGRQDSGVGCRSGDCGAGGPSLPALIRVWSRAGYHRCRSSTDCTGCVQCWPSSRQAGAAHQRGAEQAPRRAQRASLRRNWGGPRPSSARVRNANSHLGNMAVAIRPSGLMSVRARAPAPRPAIRRAAASRAPLLPLPHPAAAAGQLSSRTQAALQPRLDEAPRQPLKARQESSGSQRTARGTAALGALAAVAVGTAAFGLHLARRQFTARHRTRLAAVRCAAAAAAVQYAAESGPASSAAAAEGGSSSEGQRRCQAVTTRGLPCSCRPQHGAEYCHIHQHLGTAAPGTSSKAATSSQAAQPKHKEAGRKDEKAALEALLAQASQPRCVAGGSGSSAASRPAQVHTLSSASVEASTSSRPPTFHPPCVRCRTGRAGRSDRLLAFPLVLERPFKVVGVNGSGGDKPCTDIGSWFGLIWRLVEDVPEAWTRDGTLAATCCCEGCDNAAVHGAHLWLVDDRGNVLMKFCIIAPVCRQHNGHSTHLPKPAAVAAAAPKRPKKQRAAARSEVGFTLKPGSVVVVISVHDSYTDLASAGASLSALAAEVRGQLVQQGGSGPGIGWVGGCPLMQAASNRFCRGHLQCAAAPSLLAAGGGPAGCAPCSARCPLARRRGPPARRRAVHRGAVAAGAQGPARQHPPALPLHDAIGCQARRRGAARCRARGPRRRWLAAGAGTCRQGAGRGPWVGSQPAALPAGPAGRAAAVPGCRARSAGPHCAQDPDRSAAASPPHPLQGPAPEGAGFWRQVADELGAAVADAERLRDKYLRDVAPLLESVAAMSVTVMGAMSVTAMSAAAS